MGWASGSYLAERIWKDIKSFIPEDKKPVIAAKIYKAFADNDADDWEFENDNLYFNYLKHNKPEDFKECCEDYEIEQKEGNNV